MRGKGFLKLNCSLLSEKEYVEKVNEIIEKSLHFEQDQAVDPIEHKEYDYLTECNISSPHPIQKLEVLKLRLIEITVKYSKQKTVNRKKIIEELTQKLGKPERSWG